MSSLRDHALLEFKAMGWDFEHATGPDRWMMDGVLALLDVFSEQGHSGSSAPYMIHLFKQLAAFEPLCPLTGEAWEWVEFETEPGVYYWQNKRCGHVFRQQDGRAYDIYGIIFREKSGNTYTNKDSRVYVTFPYTPKREYRDV